MRFVFRNLTIIALGSLVILSGFFHKATAVNANRTTMMNSMALANDLYLLDMPAGYIGSWRGNGVQTNPAGSWTVLMTLTDGKLGSVVGIIAYPSLECGGELSLKSVASDTITLYEDITYGSNCLSGGTITVNLTSEDTLEFTWAKVGFAGTAQGNMSKISNNGIGIQSDYIGTWRGNAVQTIPSSQWTISVSINGGDVGEVVGTIAYPSLRCGGELTLMNVNSDSIELFEDITFGTSRCEDEGTNIFTVTPDAEIDYYWKKADFPGIANGKLKRTDCSPEQWYAEYYDNRDLNGVTSVWKCDSDIDFYWGTNQPHNNVPADNFSIRWKRMVELPETGWYRFRTFTDDGLRLYIDGNKIIDDWTPRAFDERSTLQYLASGYHQITMDYVEWSNDAMAHLDWYFCPNGENDCSMDITPEYQTQYLDAPMPAGCSTEANQTVATYGCLITSYAMALQNLGINIDPNELNTLLSNEPGAYAGACDGNLQGPGFVTKVISETYEVDLDWVSVPSIDNAKTAIRNGHPVIMNSPGHFFLAVDVAEINNVETLGINDPHHAWACWTQQDGTPPPVKSELVCSGTNLDHETSLYDRFTGAGPLGYLEQSTQPRTPSLQFYAEGAELLLSDDLGNSVGYDPIKGEVVFEIPDSFYYDTEIIPPGENSSGMVERILYLPENAGGIYNLKIIGSSDGGAQDLKALSSFQIHVVGFDNQFATNESWINGVIENGGTVEAIVEFKPGQEVHIIPLGEQLIYLPSVIK